MLPNEGLVTGDTQGAVKTVMLRQLACLGPTDPDSLERAVFGAVTGGRREDVDWEVEGNHAGYFLWIRTFDGLIEELVTEGYVRVEEDRDGRRTLVPVE